jgi:hypothetical protein
VILVRAYAPHGYYWAQGLAFQDAVYVPGPELVFTACRVWPNDYSREPFSEFDNPTLEEMRLLAALVLPIGYDEGLICPQPLSEPLRFPSAVTSQIPPPSLTFGSAPWRNGGSSQSA